MKIEYNNLYTHFIFTTFLREELILNKNRVRIEKYVTGIVNNTDCQLYAIYANPEHMHFLVSGSPRIDEESLAGIIANSTANFINKNKLCKCNFQWQMSCSAFSVSKKDVDYICKYILTQPEHHKRQSFKDEFDSFIKFYQKPINPR